MVSLYNNPCGNRIFKIWYLGYPYSIRVLPLHFCFKNLNCQNTKMYEYLDLFGYFKMPVFPGKQYFPENRDSHDTVFPGKLGSRQTRIPGISGLLGSRETESQKEKSLVFRKFRFPGKSVFWDPEKSVSREVPFYGIPGFPGNTDSLNPAIPNFPNFFNFTS